MTFKLFHNQLNLLVVIKVTSVSVLQWNSSEPSAQTQMTNSLNASVSVSRPSSRHYRESLVIKSFSAESSFTNTRPSSLSHLVGRGI